MLFVQPVILGAGIGVFGNTKVDLKKFNRKKVCELGNGFTLLCYEKLNVI